MVKTWLKLGILLALALVGCEPAYSAVVFDWRSDQIPARFCGMPGCVGTLFYTSTDTAPAITVDGTSGVFGGSILPFGSGTATLEKGIFFQGAANFSATNKFTILERIKPGFSTGGIAHSMAIFFIGLYDESYLRIEIQPDSTITVQFRDRTTGIGASLSSSAFAFTSGTPTDIQITWDGSLGSNRMKFSQDGVLISQTGASDLSFNSRWQYITPIAIGIRPDSPGSTTLFGLNELVLFNTAESATYATRTGFYTVSAQDGSSFTDPGITHVQSGTTYTFGGVSETGTLSSTDPGIANVRLGTGYTINNSALTGTAAIPAASNVKTGIAVDNTTGTLTCNDPGIANVRSGTAYTIYSAALTGTAAIPTASNVKTGISVDNTTGTLTCTDPGIANVRSSTAYQVYSVGFTGTAAIPAAVDVRFGTPVDATTGLLNLPSAANVLLGVSFDNGSQTGTLTSTDPGRANVKLGTAYTINNTPHIGILDPGASVDPGVTNVRLGTIYEIDGALSVGTLNLPAVSTVKSGVTFDNGTQTGTLLSTDPGVGEVSAGIPYEINSVPLVGTRGVVTNEYLEAIVVSSGTTQLDQNTVTVTQGDTTIWNMVAQKGNGLPFDLTGAVLTEYVVAPAGQIVSIPASQGVVDPDQVNNKGQFLVNIYSIDTGSMAVGPNREILVKAVQGSNTLYFHAPNILTVLPPVPIQ